jgi:tight adherence protein B
MLDLIFIPEIMIATVAIALAIACGVYAMTDQIEWCLNYAESDLRIQLRQMRMNTKDLRRYMVAWWLIVLLTLIVNWVGFGLPVLGSLLALLMVFFPWWLIRRAARIRHEKIEDQLADSMVSLSSSIKAGLSLPQSIEVLAKQSPLPICQEFQQIYGEYQMGKTMERCLIEAKERLRSENFALFAAAMEASRKSGGRLNETVERIAYSVRELQRLMRKLKSETAQARASALYMALSPFAVLTMYYFFVDQENTERLFTTVVGQIILGISTLFMLIAYFWSRYILNPEI